MGQNMDNKGRHGSNQRSFGGRGNGSRFNGNRNNNFSSQDREMHKAVCSKCGNDCQVPFKPTEGKPVYCKDCFVKKKRF